MPLSFDPIDPQARMAAAWRLIVALGTPAILTNRATFQNLLEEAKDFNLTAAELLELIEKDLFR